MQLDPPASITLPVTATVRDGRQVALRAIQVQDKEELRTAFHRLSADSRYTRFLSAMREPPEAMLDAVTHPAAGREFAVVAVSGEGSAERIVASARYVGAAGSDTCEFAVTVADDWHGLGLAKHLMRILIETAPTHGFRCMEGYVLSINTAMRRLAMSLGFVDTLCHDDPTLRVVKLDLPAGGHRTTKSADAPPA